MTNTLAAVLRNSHIFLKNISLPVTNISGYKLQGLRTLYSATTLGIDGYLQQKERTKVQLSHILPKFREKMQETVSEDSKGMVFTEDLKNMLHLAENKEDIDILIKMMEKFNQQNKKMRFGNFVFGPVVMRMFYYLNKPEEAYQCFKSPKLEGFFDQIMSYQILLDLLYEHQRYNDILEAFAIIKDKQIEGIKFAKNVVVLTLAACYKLNTKESLEFALKLWSDLQDIGHLPMRRATTYCAALAVNQGKPDVAIEVLSNAKNQNYTTIRNTKVSALIDLGRIDEAIGVLKSILHQDSASLGTIQTFCTDVIEKARAAVEKSGNAEMKLEFSKVEQYFKEQKHISNLTLDQQLCQEIATPPLLAKRSRNFRDDNQNYGRNRFQPRSQTTGQGYLRPGLSDMQ